MDAMRYPEWQGPFQEALLEIDREKLQSKMMKAEEAIFQRMQQLAGSSDSEAERQAIEDGLQICAFSGGIISDSCKTKMVSHPQPSWFRAGYSKHPI